MALTTTWPARELSAREVDVLVAGGGPAGVAAAIAAAREGAATLLVERFGYLGGMATAALVPCWAPFSDKEKLVVRGLLLEVVREMIERTPHLKAEQYAWVPIDFELLKRILDRRVAEAGAEVLLLTQLADVRADRGAVREALILNAAGLSAVRAKVFIDATGEGELVARAGGAFELGQPDTGELQPTTPCFVLANVDTDKYFAWQEAIPGRQNLRDAVAAAKAAGDLDIPETHGVIIRCSPTRLGINFSHVYDVDATDPARLSAAMVEGRRLARHLGDFLVKYCPGCEGGELVQTGGIIGIRESRRIVGEYRLVLDDYMARRHFDDEIALNSYYLDLHYSKADWQRYAAGEFTWQDRGKPYGPGDSHGIPFGCLIPRGLTNVLAAGRCASSDRFVQGAIRVMPTCMAMGEAAGAAAAMAVAGDHDVRGVDVHALREKLRQHGAYLP